MKRIVFYSAFILITIIVETVNWICLLLDELIFASYRRIKIKSPLFIIGMPRSGTTFLFNIMGADKDRFTSLKLWEILFAPSIIQKFLLISIFKIDKKLHGILFRKLKKWDKRLFAPYEKIHRISFFNIEEDEFILIHILASALMVFIFPRINKIESLTKFDEDVSSRRKKRIMSFYKKCVQKHIYVFGMNKIYLSKSPSHASKILSLKETFIDCKFIYMLRIPEQTISSAIGMYKVYNKIFHSQAKLQRLINGTLILADYMYDYPLRKVESWNTASSTIIKFEDIIKYLDDIIIKLYEQFHYELSDNFRKIIIDQREKSVAYKSPLQHSASMYGLDINDIHSRYHLIYSQFYNFQPESR